MSKIVYLIEQPLDTRNYDRFGIQTWIDREWEVEVWDLTPLSYPRVWKNYFERGHKLKEFEGYFPIASRSELKCCYARAMNLKYFMDLTGDNFYSIQVKMRLLRIGVIRVIFAVGSIPELSDSRASTLVSRVRKAIEKGLLKSFKSLFNAFLHKLAVSFIRPGIGIISGEKSIHSVGYAFKIVKAHNLDYDIYLKLKKSIDISGEEYIVFIDQDLCFHPDNLYEGGSYSVTPEKYFSTICNGLKKISDYFGIAMCVAAHPRSSYKKMEQDFEGIPIQYGKTAELIRNCKFVVCHYSTVIQFAVLFKKPIVFVTTNELITSSIGKYIHKFASILGKSPINLDGDWDNIDWNKELRFDTQKYLDYKNKYIKIDGSPEKPLWEIVIDNIVKSISFIFIILV